MQISLWLCSIARNNEFLFLVSSNTIVTSGFPAVRAISRGFFIIPGIHETVKMHSSKAPFCNVSVLARRSNLTFIANIARSEQLAFRSCSSPSLPLSLFSQPRRFAQSGCKRHLEFYLPRLKLGSVVPLFVASIKPILGTIYRYAHVCP